MALTVSQIQAVSYNDVLNAMRGKPENQWGESSFMRELERQGAIKHIPGGPQIEATLDYRINPGADFLATDMTALATGKTEVLTAAVYDPAQLSVPIVWSKADEAKNPTQNQKVALAKSLMENGINSHDETIESALFSTSTDGFLGLQTIVPDSGQGTVGGIDAAVETWWRNYTANYLANFSDIEAQMTEAFNEAAKGSGSSLAPTLLVSDAETHAGFEGTQQSLQRYIDTQDAKVGFKTLAFKTARFVFSQYSTTRVYFLNPKSFNLDVFKGYFRKKGDTIEFQNQEAYISRIGSMLQAKTNNKSRLAVLTRV